MAIICRQKGSGKRSRVREKSVKSQGILIRIMSGNPVYGKNPSKNLLLKNGQADFHETWYVASGTPAHHSLFK